MLSTFLKGMAVSGGLIIAIGGQNAFLLKQGLLKQHIFWIASICFLCDIFLISIGVLGIGGFISQNQTFAAYIALAGALFLFVYGARAFYASYKGSTGLIVNNDDKPAMSRKKTILTTLAVTLLNPHAYLDAVVIMGGIAATLSDSEKIWFLLGSLVISFLWFFGVGYGARFLQPLFKSTRSWRILDFFIGVIMWQIAYALIRYFGQQI